tara:strand:+ start:579 stop:917 length:339 start_codon:yes stop_codon:yes gene_type:complete
MTRYKYINGKRIKFTKAEETARDKEELDWSNGAFDRAILKLRENRNKLLADSDWMANSDVVMSDEWKTYRQELRDITSGLDTVEKVNIKLKVDEDKNSKTFGKLINFPTKPE